MDKVTVEQIIRANLVVLGMAGFIYSVDALLYHYGVINARDTNVSATALYLAVSIFLCYEIPKPNSKIVGFFMLSLRGWSMMLRRKE